MSFLKEPDIWYCNLEQMDTLYTRKDANGEKLFVEKYYLRLNLREVVSIFNADQANKVSYHIVQKIVDETKNIFSNERRWYVDALNVRT